MRLIKARSPFSLFWPFPPHSLFAPLSSYSPLSRFSLSLSLFSSLMSFFHLSCRFSLPLFFPLSHTFFLCRPFSLFRLLLEALSDETSQRPSCTLGPSHLNLFPPLRLFPPTGLFPPPCLFLLFRSPVLYSFFFLEEPVFFLFFKTAVYHVVISEKNLFWAKSPLQIYLFVFLLFSFPNRFAK